MRECAPWGASFSGTRQKPAWLRAKASAWRIKHVYWFSVDDEPATCNFCNGSGLFKKGFVPKKSWTEFVKFTGGTA